MLKPTAAAVVSPPVAVPESSVPETARPTESPTLPATAKKPAAKTASASAASVPNAASPEKKLSPKELKEKKKAEKAAKRAQNREAGSSGGAGEKGAKETASAAAKGGKKQSEGPVSTIRIGGSTQKAKQAAIAATETEPAKEAEAVREHGLVGLLRDLEVEQNGKKKSQIFGIDNAHPDVHPAIITLGMQINKNVIVGSSARCMGFLLAIKRVRIAARIASGDGC